MSVLGRNLLALLVIFMVLGMLFIGLHPFNFFPENRVLINGDGPGVHFFGRGIAYSTEFGDWPGNGPVTLDLVLEPERYYTHRVPHILTLCDRSGLEVMYFGQWEDTLVLRLVEGNPWMEKIDREIDVGDLLHPGKTIRIDLVLSEGSTGIYVNGQLLQKYDDFDFASAVLKRPVHTIVLGNASTGDSSWRGKILELAVFNGAMDPNTIRDQYARWKTGPGQDIRDVTAPEDLTPIRREFLSLSTLQDLDELSFYKDAVINVAGFIPLGLVLSLLLSGISNKKNAALSIITPVLIGGLLSLIIETSQAFLLSRSSSMIDLVLNILGTGIGAMICWRGKGIIPDSIRLR